MWSTAWGGHGSYPDNNIKTQDDRYSALVEADHFGLHFNAVWGVVINHINSHHFLQFTALGLPPLHPASRYNLLFLPVRFLFRRFYPRHIPMALPQSRIARQKRQIGAVMDSGDRGKHWYWDHHWRSCSQHWHSAAAIEQPGQLDIFAVRDAAFENRPYIRFAAGFYSAADCQPIKPPDSRLEKSSDRHTVEDFFLGWKYRIRSIGLLTGIDKYLPERIVREIGKIAKMYRWMRNVSC